MLVTAVHEYHRSPKQLRRGITLVTIAHAVACARTPQIAHEHSWDGMTYVVENTMGAYGAATFDNGEVVAAFFDGKSPRAAEHKLLKQNIQACLAGAPKNLREIAVAETFQYLLQDMDGEAVPLVTAAFWSRRNSLVAPEPWDDVFAHGAHLVRIHLLEVEQALQELRIEYEFDDEQTDLVYALFRRRTSHPGEFISMSGDDFQRLIAYGDEGIDACRQLLEDTGIRLPATASA
jgi:hypothetical protein